MEQLRHTRRFGRTVIVTLLLAIGVLIVPPALGTPVAATSSRDGGRVKPTIVLVHGDWADASSWTPVVERLQRRGYTVVAPPNPLRGPTGDAAYIASFLQTIAGPIVLVAHSYGGFVITNAATGNANVEALVYIDAFIPDVGQTVADLATGSCIDASGDAFDVVPGPGGVVDVYLRRDANGAYRGFSHCFANGVDRRVADVLVATQRPATLNQFAEPSGPPAWATIPSWSLIGTADRVIPAAQQRAMSTHAGATISTVDAGHLSLLTRPKAVTKLIEAAVEATS